jgi:hypothetical protein
VRDAPLASCNESEWLSTTNRMEAGTREVLQVADRRATVVLGLVLALAPITSGPSAGAVTAPSDDSGECVYSASAARDARALRSAVGIASDPAIVESSFTDAAFACTRWGIPLTEQEIDQFQLVLAAQDELTNAIVPLMARDDYAGAYFEADALTIAFTRETADVRSELEEVMRRHSVTITEAQFTEAELQTVADEVRAQYAAIEASGIEIVLVAVDPRANRVEVGVASALDDAVKYLGSMFGESVMVTHRPHGHGGLLACTVDNCETKGGLYIRKGTLAVRQCTSGFLARARKYGSSIWKKYILTAGHCLEGTASHLKWQNGAQSITWGEDEAWHLFNGGGILNDLGLIRMGNVTPARWNEYYRPAVWPIEGSTHPSNQLIGHIVCRHGWSSGAGCGRILRRNADIKVDGTWYYLTWEVELRSRKGDSGAGFYREIRPDNTTMLTAYGILSGGQSLSGGYLTYYYPADNVFASQGPGTGTYIIEPCTTSSC